jgi:hypothetical protein
MEFLGTLLAGALYGFASWFFLSLFFAITDIAVPEWALILCSIIIALMGLRRGND